MATRPRKRSVRIKESPASGGKHEEAMAEADRRCDALAVVRGCIETRRASWERKGVEVGTELPCGPLPWLSLDESMLCKAVEGALDSVAARLHRGVLHVALWWGNARPGEGRLQMEVYGDESAGVSLAFDLEKHPAVSPTAPIDMPNRALLIDEHSARARILQAQCACLGLEVEAPVSAKAALATAAEAPHRMVWLGGRAADIEVRRLASAIRRAERKCGFPSARIVALRDAGEDGRWPDIDVAVDWPVSLDHLRALCATVQPPEESLSDAVRLLFLSESRRDAVIIREAIDLGDWSTVVRHAHRIKGGTVVLGESVVCAQAERVEQAARHAVPDRTQLRKLLAELEAELRGSR